MNQKQTLSTGIAATAIIALSAVARLYFGDVPHTAHAAARSPSRLASVDQDLRYVPTTRPFEPQPQHPPEPTTQNTDADKPPQQWQRLTGDWGGIRTRLEDRGITFEGSIAGYFGKNLTGGVNTGKNGGAYLLNINATLDSQKLWGYPGGTFFINFRTENGLHTSLDGSLESTSHLYSPERTEASEAWYEQKLLYDKVRVRIGKIDANTEFANNSNGGEFLNSYASNAPTIVAFPTDPNPAFGVDVFVYPTSNFYAGIGAYDGSLQTGVSTGLTGPANVFHLHSEFLIAEVGATWTAPGARDGRLGIGVWHDTAALTRFGGGTENGATGPYLTLDQTLWRKNPDVDGDKQGIAMFGTAGYADPGISAVNYQFGGGLKWTGPITSRGGDILGFGASYIRLSADTGSGFTRPDETTIETFYKLRLNTWFSVQPDLQYIHNPGGVASRHDAIAFTLQALVDF